MQQEKTMNDYSHPRTAFPADLVPGSLAYLAEAYRRTRAASAEGFHDNDAAQRISEEERRIEDEDAFLRENGISLGARLDF